MPELPEVETVVRSLKDKVLNKKISKVKVFYESIIEYPSVDKFKEKLVNERINDITRRGKWIIFHLDEYYLLSHLRMEGKYNIKNKDDELEKHEHVCFEFTDNTELRYKDTRKFGRMHLIEKDELYERKPLNELGLEPWDEKLDNYYLKTKYKDKKNPIKTVLLDQKIIVGIGNIYADEILFKSKINPYKKASSLSNKDLDNIIKYTRETLNDAIKDGGTTIRTYTSSEGVHGRFQQNLLVHNRLNEKCLICNTKIIKEVINGRGTYYCKKCQK